METLRKTQSVCPVCLKTVDAAYIEKEKHVYMEKCCKDHGEFSCQVSENADDFTSWSSDVINIKPRDVLSESSLGCPHDCGPCDRHLQTACCVLLDVTDRCNQHCPICFASAETDGKCDMPISEIEKQLDALLELSEERKFNIQLSGGEPTVRDDLPEVIQMAKSRGFEYVQLNTNGRRIANEDGYADRLKSAGLDAVFLQFDGLDDKIYDRLRGEPLLAVKKKAIENCRKSLLPVALVPTVAKGINDGQIGPMIDFMLENVNVIKGIHFQPISLFGRFPDELKKENRITLFDVLNKIEEQSNGKIQKSSLAPLATGHNLCCFYGSFLRRADGQIESMTKHKKEKPAEDCYEITDENSCCCDASDGVCCPTDIEIIQKDRDYVRNRWKMADADIESEDGFDRIVADLRKNSFTLTGMAFQDAMNLDTERISRCRVQVFSKDHRLIPFCTYNLTSQNGDYLYRQDYKLT